MRPGLTSRLLAVLALGFTASLTTQAQVADAQQTAQLPKQDSLPPKLMQAQKFLAERAWTPSSKRGRTHAVLGSSAATRPRADATGAQTSAAAAAWQALGPAAVLTPGFSLVTGRVSALALDPSDSTGNHLYLGTTGGGVWVAQNAGTANAPSVVFAPLTDNVGALSGALDASISIGALTVQPGGSGVILAGTGDPNDALDSYYGAGILRSGDGGNTWSLISTTADKLWGFAGEGFAGFAWSTVNPQLVVAAVSQAYEGTLVNAEVRNRSYQGLYYSADGGATWNLATITDGSGADVQGPTDAFAGPDGNAATAVVWNPVRQLFVAAVRYHGYYQSSDGMTWARMAAQPGAGLAATSCPTNIGSVGSINCPIFRGALAVNQETGDTFAWTTDAYNQDQGLWQDQCVLNAGACSHPGIAFSRQWNTAALEASTANGAATIENGDYTLALAAVPSQQDTVLLAGADDLWKCSLAAGCVWRNTTNSATCKSAQVGEYQHALAWNAANPLEIFVGNDSGLWRSMDAIGESGPVCAATDASHFQNLNSGLGSLAEVVSLSVAQTTPFTMLAGLGANGTAGVTSTTGPTADWPQVLGGEGGPVAIAANANALPWYANNAAGVSIYLCGSLPCTSSAFGASAAINNADVGGDGDTMTTPAPFLVDPVDSTQLLIATCRVWRGPADGSGWSGANAISPSLDSGTTGVACNGNALIRTIAAAALLGGGEVIYVGIYGALDGGASRAGHVFGTIIASSGSSTPVWKDLTLNPVTNQGTAMNAYGLDISSIVIDPHDASGQTVYVTVAGVANSPENVQVVYRSTDGGAHWADATSNLPFAPANSLAVDPQDANTVYIATDTGVYFTTQIASCTNSPSTCWSAFGTGLPEAPVVELSASPAASSSQVLVAATYGRGIWQAPLWTAGVALTTAAASPALLTFASQAFGTTSAAQTVTLTNTGSAALTPTAIAVSGDFSETDNCQNTSIAAGASCAIQVTFTPTTTGARTGQMTIGANISGGQLTVELSGSGTPAGAVSLTPASINFGAVAVGSTSAPLQVEAGNSSGTPIPITGVSISPPFTIASNSCATLAAQTDCQITVAFAPTQAGPATGTLTLIDGAGTQTVALSGTGAALPTDTLSPLSLAFPATAIGQLSTAQTVTLTNSGALPLTSIAASVSGPFLASSNCGTQLAGPASCSISVVFDPTQLGSQAGTLTVSDITRTKPQTIALSGTGVQPAVLSVSPASLNFMGQPTGVASAPMTLTVSNAGGVPLANVGFAITGPAASSFATGTTTCAATLNSGSGCTVQVIFTPAAAAGSAATLVVSSSTLGVAPVPVPLNGNGAATTVLSVSPLRLAFPAEFTGQASAAQTVTVTNAGSFSATSLTLTVAAPFSLTQDTCTGVNLAAAANCTVAVIFTPNATGVATGTLTVASASVMTPASVPLSGDGEVPFDFTVAVSGSSAQTVASGQMASYTLVITPSNGAPGAFTFQCGTLPANATCLFNPSTETLSPGVTGNVTVQVATGGATTASLSSHTARWRWLPLACGLVLLPLGWRRRKALLLAALLAILAGSVSSCTSSGGGTGGGANQAASGGATPPGTFTIPATVASGGVQHSVSLTLTVD